MRRSSAAAVSLGMALVSASSSSSSWTVLMGSEKGYVVIPLDAVTSDDAHDAQLAIELGAAELTVGRLSAAAVAELRQLAEATSSLIVDDHILDVESYVAKNVAFHSYIVRATGIAALARAYESLSLPELMIRALVAPVCAMTQTARFTPDVEEAAQRLRDLSEQNDRDQQEERRGLA